MKIKHNPDILESIKLVAIAAIGLWLVAHIGGSGSSSYSPNRGSADATGSTGTGTTPISGTPIFRFEKVEYPSILRPGEMMSVTWTVTHVGPGGHYIAGLDLVPAHTLCLLGFRNASPEQVIQNIEGDLFVQDDPTPRRYVTLHAVPYSGWGPTIMDVRGYVRDTSGRILLEGWTCGGTMTLGV